jgi:hypothetical protein
MDHQMQQAGYIRLKSMVFDFHCGRFLRHLVRSCLFGCNSRARRPGRYIAAVAPAFKIRDEVEARLSP